MKANKTNTKNKKDADVVKRYEQFEKDMAKLKIEVEKELKKSIEEKKKEMLKFEEDFKYKDELRKHYIG